MVRFAFYHHHHILLTNEPIIYFYSASSARAIREERLQTAKRDDGNLSQSGKLKNPVTKPEGSCTCSAIRRFDSAVLADVELFGLDLLGRRHR